MEKRQNNFAVLIKSLVPMLMAISIQVLVSFIAEIVVLVALGIQNSTLLSLAYETEGFEGAYTKLAVIYSNFYYNTIYADVLTFIIMVVLAMVFGLWFFKSKASKGMAPIMEALPPRNIILILVAGVFVQIGMSMLLSLILPLFPTILEQYEGIMENLAGQDTVFSVVAISLLAPFAEELIFRGLTLRGTRTHWKSFVLVNFLQALYFGIYHMNIVQGVYAFIMGLVFGYVSYTLNNVFASIIFHASVNSSSYLLGVIVPESVYTSVIGMILIAAASTALVWALLYLLKKPAPVPEEKPEPKPLSYAEYVQLQNQAFVAQNVDFNAPVVDPEVLGQVPEHSEVSPVAEEPIQPSEENPEISAQDENKEN